MKNEPCSFDRCRFSLQCNHIHCVRENCYYVLHSSGQLLSHKRKHDRMDSEQAYQQFKLAQKNDETNDIEMGGSEAMSVKSLSQFPGNLSTLLSKYAENDNKMEALLSNESMEILQQLQFQKQALLQSQAAKAAVAAFGKSNDDDITADNNNYDAIDQSSVIPKSFIQNTSATMGRSITSAELDQLKQIYSTTESAKQKQINALLFAQNNFCSADQAEPLNLNLKKDNVKDVNASLLSAVVQKMQNQNMPTNLQQITSIDGLFNRKRGRPPKNRVVEVYGNVSVTLKKINFYRLKP